MGDKGEGTVSPDQAGDRGEGTVSPGQAGDWGEGSTLPGGPRQTCPTQQDTHGQRAADLGWR